VGLKYWRAVPLHSLISAFLRNFAEAGYLSYTQLMTVQKTIVRFCSMALVVGVYSIFFAVQLFFNFASGKNVSSSKYHLFSGLVAKNKPVAKDPKSGTHQLGFRLNKHFQPKSLPSVIFHLPAIPVCFICHVNIPANPVDFISSLIYSSTPLRGPPQMNNIS
jgi:hypothetical protein